MFESFDISVSGLVANRIWADTTASNIANINSTHDADGKPIPYARRAPVFSVTDPSKGPGVEVSEIQVEESYKLEMNPSHPDAIQRGPLKGMVRMPNVDLYQETVNGMVAERAYEANITALQVTKQMYAADLRILA
jgi:flagellar basal-body rod protein FlgC